MNIHTYSLSLGYQLSDIQINFLINYNCINYLVRFSKQNTIIFITALHGLANIRQFGDSAYKLGDFSLVF